MNADTILTFVGILGAICIMLSIFSVITPECWLGVDIRRGVPILVILGLVFSGVSPFKKNAYESLDKWYKSLRAHRVAATSNDDIIAAQQIRSEMGVDEYSSTVDEKIVGKDVLNIFESGFSRDHYTFSGKARNAFNQTLTDIYIACNFYNNSGEVIGYGTDSFHSSLEPDEVWNFSINHTGDTRPSTIKLTRLSVTAE